MEGRCNNLTRPLPVEWLAAAVRSAFNICSSHRDKACKVKVVSKAPPLRQKSLQAEITALVSKPLYLLEIERFKRHMQKEIEGVGERERERSRREGERERETETEREGRQKERAGARELERGDDTNGRRYAHKRRGPSETCGKQGQCHLAEDGDSLCFSQVFSLLLRSLP